MDNNKIHNVLKLLQKINNFNNNETSQETQNPELTDELPECSHTSANKTKTVVDDQVPGPSKTKTVAVEKGPSKIKIVVDDEVLGPSGYKKKQRGQFISEKHWKKVNLLKNKYEITAQFRKQYTLFNRLEFGYYYKDAKT